MHSRSKKVDDQRVAQHPDHSGEKDEQGQDQMLNKWGRRELEPMAVDKIQIFVDKEATFLPSHD